MAVVVALLLLMLFMIGNIIFERSRHEAYEELKRAYKELLNEHLELLSRYNGLKEAYEVLKARFGELRANYSEAWFRAGVYWKALMFLGNRSITLRLKVAAPYEEGFKFGVIEVKIPLWKYALYKVCGNPKRLGLDPYNDTVLYEIVERVREWLIHEGLFDEERFANALVSIAQLLPYNKSRGGWPVETLVDGGVCWDKAQLAVVLLRIAGYDTVIVCYGDHTVVAVHLSRPPKFALGLGYYHGRLEWCEPEDAWYIVLRGKKYYLVQSTSPEPHTIGTMLGRDAIGYFKKGDVHIDWPYYGERPEKIHAPPYRDE
ncbi:MAG: hypothetical protein DRJ60_02665 [Thermoprotei archaeon]|nr:MAG: hypothetical protein DRJ60_02665 [Thermoprotei archaeon]